METKQPTTTRNRIPEMLHAFIEERGKAAFAWGKNDCCLLAADWAKLATGADFAAEFRGTYDSAASAAIVLDARGGVAGIVAEIAAREQWESVAVNFAQRGDIALLADHNGRDALGIATGFNIACQGKDGIVFMPNKSAKALWRIL